MKLFSFLSFLGRTIYFSYHIELNYVAKLKRAHLMNALRCLNKLSKAMVITMLLRCQIGTKIIKMKKLGKGVVGNVYLVVQRNL